MSLHEAKAAFDTNPTPRTCGEYLAALRDSEAEGGLTDDEFLNGLSEVQSYLLDWES